MAVVQYQLSLENNCKMNDSVVVKISYGSITNNNNKEARRCCQENKINLHWETEQNGPKNIRYRFILDAIR